MLTKKQVSESKAKAKDLAFINKVKAKPQASWPRPRTVYSQSLCEASVKVTFVSL